MHSNSRDGIQLDLFGRAPAPVNPSASPERVEELPTSDTSGRSGSGSSASVDLASSLANRLKVLCATDGSMEYRQTWKVKATPSGRLYWAHTASGRRTSDNGFSGWPSPNTPSGGRSVSPDKMSSTGVTLDGRKHTVSLEHVVKFAGWTAQDHSRGDKPPRPQDTGVPLSQMAALAGWSTPCAPRKHDSDASAFRWNPNKAQDDPAMQILGRTQSLSSVPTEKRGALNPAFSRWLQGYPKAWCEAAIRAHRSMPMRRRKRA